MKKLPWLLLNWLLFHSFTYGIDPPPGHVPTDLVNETKTVVVNCGMPAKCEYLDAEFADNDNTLLQDGLDDIVNLYLLSYDGLYHFRVHHPISVPGLTGAWHSKPGFKGHLEKCCTYQISCFINISNFSKQYSYYHVESTDGSEACSHYDLEP